MLVELQLTTVLSDRELHVGHERQTPDSNSQSTSTSLLDAARLQDQHAWLRLVNLYEPLICDWCKASQIQPADISDIVQEVFAAVWKYLGDFQKTKPGDSFRGWLRVITRNKICDYFRRCKLQSVAVGGTTAQLQFQEIPEPLSDESAEVAFGEEQRVFLRALELIQGEFEPKTWSAFWMMVVDRRSVAETAQELAISAGAVRQSKYKVLRRIRLELGNLMADLPPAGENV